MSQFRFRSAVFLQFMGTVGSGIFVLPYVFNQSNFVFATVFLIYLTVITIVLNHFYVEIVNATPTNHQLTGYTQIYLGKRFKLLTTLNLMLLAYGAILAYSKLFTSFFLILTPSLPVFIVKAIYLATVLMLFYNQHRLGKNLFVFIPIFMILIPIFLFALTLIPTLEIRNLKLDIFPSLSFYGPLLFALSGFTIIPEVRRELGTSRGFALAVSLGVVLVAIVYFLFSYSVIKLSGSNLSLDALSGLAANYPNLSRLLALFGIVITARASFSFLLILHELFYRDLNFSHSVSNLLPIIFPLVAVFMGSISLLTIISLTGHLTIFVSAIIICLVRLKLPQTFVTQFFMILIIISLTLGLWF